MIVIILFFIIGIAAGSILGILYMMVIEKTRDIGILRSMGLSSRRVVAVFVGCGAVLGIIGSSAGLALGLAIVRNINAIKDWLAGWPFYFEVFNPKVYRFKDIPTKLVPEWVAGHGHRGLPARGARGRDPGGDGGAARPGEVPQG